MTTYIEFNLKTLYIFVLMLVSACVFLYIFMVWNESWNKAMLFDVYNTTFEQVKDCKTQPLCICQLPEGVHDASEGLVISP